VFAALCWSGRRSLTLGAAACVAGGLLIVVLAGKGMNVSYDYGFFRCIFGFFTGYFAFSLWQGISPQMRHWMGRCEIPAVGAVILFLVYASDNVVSVVAPFLFGPVVLVFAGERGLVSRAMR